MTFRRYGRITIGVVLLLTVTFAATGVLGEQQDPQPPVNEVTDADITQVEPRDGITVITGNGFQNTGGMMAYYPNGSLMYTANRLEYGDVDPVPNTTATVVYSGQAHDLSKMEREGCTGYNDQRCTRQVIEKVNLSTGEVNRIYSKIVPADIASNWHDVDHVSGQTYVVADIYHDRVLFLNVSTNVTTWSYSFQHEYPIAFGGKYPNDWTHVNDVEVLPDGRLMVSLRNQDQVAFLTRSGEVQLDWILGQDLNTTLLYGQHNPDYIPESQGGPAILVADSMNHRVIEYQRVNGSWEQSWVWRDSDMQWPRDVDRLPNGNSLIADTNNNRVMEVNRAGDIVWKVPFYKPYDVERLSTPDESGGAQSATRLDLESRTVTGSTGEDERSQADKIQLWLKSVLPNEILNALAFVAPPWLGLWRTLAVILVLPLAVCWGVLELAWRYSVTVSVAKKP